MKKTTVQNYVAKKDVLLEPKGLKLNTSRSNKAFFATLSGMLKPLMVLIFISKKAKRLGWWENPGVANLR